MTRNLKKESLKKLLQIRTANGYTVDVANYIYNPCMSHDYPNMKKVIAETADGKQISNIYYSKYWKGGGRYVQETYTEPNETGGTWFCVTNPKQTVIEEAPRFSLKRLQQIAEAL